MPRFAQLAQPQPIRIGLPGDETLTLHYLVADVSGMGFAQITEDASAAEDAHDPKARATALAQGLAPMLRDWDFLEEEGSATPLTVERLVQLGDARLYQIFAQIRDDIYPN